MPATPCGEGHLCNQDPSSADLGTHSPYVDHMKKLRYKTWCKLYTLPKLIPSNAFNPRRTTPKSKGIS